MILVILIVALSHRDKLVPQIQMVSMEERKLGREAHLQQLSGQVHLVLPGGKVHLLNPHRDPQQNPCPQRQPDTRAKMILVTLVIEPRLLDQHVSLSHPEKIVLRIQVLPAEERKLDGEVLPAEERKLDGEVLLQQVHLVLLDGKVHLLNLDGDPRQYPCQRAEMILVMLVVALSHRDTIVPRIQALSAEERKLDGEALLRQLGGQVHPALLDGKVHLLNLDGAKMILVILVVALSHPDKIVLWIQVLLAEERKLDGEALLLQLGGQMYLVLLDGKVHLLNLRGDRQQNHYPRAKMILVLPVVALSPRIQMLSVEERKLDGEVLLQQLGKQVHLLLPGGKAHMLNLDGDPQQKPCPQQQPGMRAKMILVTLVEGPRLLDQDLSLSHPDKIVLWIQVLSAGEMKLDGEVFLQQLGGQVSLLLLLDGKVHMLNLHGDPRKMNLHGDPHQINLHKPGWGSTQSKR
jgi:hypothetical protein